MRWTRLVAYAWPGNIRELRNVVERAALLCDGGEIRREHLAIAGMQAEPGPGSAGERTWARATSTGPEGAPPPSLDAAQIEERRRIVDALERCVWNQTYAAEMLGISRRTLVTRLRAYGIARPRTRPPELT